MFTTQALRSTVIAVAMGLTALTSLAVESANQPLVILVTIDGLAADYLADPQAPLPTLRRLASEGAVAEGLRVSNPTVTWPNHTTLVTGVHPDKHSVLFNGRLIRPAPGSPVKIDGECDQQELVAVPTLYDVLHQAGLRTAGINWPCTRRSSTLDDNFPDVPNPLANMTRRLRAELIRDGVLESDSDRAFQAHGPAAADTAWMAAAVHLLKSRPPNLLLLHLLITDSIQHRHGPQSMAAYTAVGLADAHLATLVCALGEAGLRDRATIFVTSDHGFARPEKLVHPNVVLRKAGLQRPAPRRRAQAVSEGGTAFVYLTQPATQAADRAQVIELLKDQEGIAAVLTPDRFAALNLPDPAKNPQMGDLLLVAKDGYAFSNEAFDDEAITEVTSAVGSHGYLATDPRMNGLFVAWGRGIKPGTKLGRVNNLDVAPTIAALFGKELSTADGKVLREVLLDATKR